MRFKKKKLSYFIKWNIKPNVVLNAEPTKKEDELHVRPRKNQNRVAGKIGFDLSVNCN